MKSVKKTAAMLLELEKMGYLPLGITIILLTDTHIKSIKNLSFMPISAGRWRRERDEPDSG